MAKEQNETGTQGQLLEDNEKPVEAIAGKKIIKIILHPNAPFSSVTMGDGLLITGKEEVTISEEQLQKIKDTENMHGINGEPFYLLSVLIG